MTETDFLRSMLRFHRGMILSAALPMAGMILCAFHENVWHVVGWAVVTVVLVLAQAELLYLIESRVQTLTGLST
jgi:hypothetical protein